MVTTVNVELMQQLLHESDFDKEESAFLVSSLKDRFEIGYGSSRKETLEADNIPF